VHVITEDRKPSLRTSAIAYALNDAALCAAHLRDLGAEIASAGVCAQGLTPYIVLHTPGALPQQLDREQRAYHALGRVRSVDLMGCVVTWTASPNPEPLEP
jgi:hypothetical protein